MTSYDEINLDEFFEALEKDTSELAIIRQKKYSKFTRKVIPKILLKLVTVFVHVFGYSTVPVTR